MDNNEVATGVTGAQNADEVPVAIRTPEVSDDQISNDLRWLTEHLMKHEGAETTGGFLGGEFGYGAEFTNPVFEMHPYYWGDCQCGHEEAESRWDAENEHRAECYQSVIRSRGFLDCDSEVPYREREATNRPIIAQVCAEMGLDPESGCLVHCTCDYRVKWARWQAEHGHASSCGIARPNFLHKPSGTRVDWYKYIGRGMESDVRGDWRAVLAECVASLTEQHVPPAQG